jgi:hypothetical protein
MYSFPCSCSVQAKYRGTLVTVESFRAWKERFEEEMNEKSGKQKEQTSTTSGRLTGERLRPVGVVSVSTVIQ